MDVDSGIENPEQDEIDNRKRKLSKEVLFLQIIPCYPRLSV